MEVSDEESPLLNALSRRESSIQSSIKLVSPLPGMQIRSHRIGSDGSIEKCSVEECFNQQSNYKKKNGDKKSKRHYWIDIIDAGPNPQQSKMKDWVKQLNLPNFVVDVLATSPESWASQVIPLPNAALTFIRVLPNIPTSDDVTHLAALNMRSILFTFTSSPRTGDFHLSVLERMKQRLLNNTSSGALVAWLGFHLDRTSQETRKLRYGVVAMDEAMDKNITSVELEEIINAKDQLLRLLSVAEEQTECLESLTAVQQVEDHHDNYSSLFTPIKASLSILLATARATERSALRLEKRIIDLRQRSEGHEQEITNRRLAILTVLSAIFLPLTLFTGIWGMNFKDMPELDVPHAYPIALAFMLIIALSMIYFFWRKGWFL